MIKEVLFLFPTFLFPKSLWILSSGPWAPFPLSLLLQLSFFLPSSALLPKKKKKKDWTGLPRGDGKTSGKGNGNPVCTHTWACVPPISQWLNLKGREGEDVLSEKHWIGLMPGSVVLFGLIKGETQRWG